MDKHQASYHGVFHSTPAEQQEDYIRPQENGSHYDCDYASLANDRVVLTAVEMGAQRRFSTITIKENNVLDGDMERLLIDGVTDILTRLPSLPPAVLVLSLIHI